MTSTPAVDHTPPIELSSTLQNAASSTQQPTPLPLPPTCRVATTEHLRATVPTVLPRPSNPSSHPPRRVPKLRKLFGGSVVGNLLATIVILTALWFGYLSVRYARDGAEYARKQLVIAQVDFCQRNAFMASNTVCVDALNGTLIGGFSGDFVAYRVEKERQLCMLELPFRVSNAKWVGVVKELLARELLQWILLLVCAVCAVRFWRSICISGSRRWRKGLLLVSLFCMLQLSTWITYVQNRLDERATSWLYRGRRKTA